MPFLARILGVIIFRVNSPLVSHHSVGLASSSLSVDKYRATNPLEGLVYHPLDCLLVDISVRVSLTIHDIWKKGKNWKKVTYRIDNFAEP